MTEADNTGPHHVPPIPIAPMPRSVSTGTGAAVTIKALQKLSAQIVGTVAAAGILGAASLGGVSYMALHDVQRDISEVTKHHDEDIAEAKEECAGWQGRHDANGHGSTTDALHRIDIRLTGIEATLEQLQNERPPRRRR